MDSFVVGITGASGTILGLKTVFALLQKGLAVDLIMTDAAKITAREELGGKEWTQEKILAYFPEEFQKSLRYYSIQNIAAPCASGSYQSKGMIIVPCSMSTLAAIALGLSDNLLRRTADVMIKERRTLLIVPREAPLSQIHLGHMNTLAKLGAILMPPQPAWYQKPQTMDQMEDFFVAKLLEEVGVTVAYPRWSGSVL